MADLNTYLIGDNRILGVTDKMSIAVKDGPASITNQKYNATSVSNTSVMFNINVPSENTLVGRDIRLQGKLYLTVDVVTPAEAVVSSFLPSLEENDDDPEQSERKNFQDKLRVLNGYGISNSYTFEMDEVPTTSETESEDPGGHKEVFRARTL